MEPIDFLARLGSGSAVPIIAGVGYLAVRALIRSLLPPGYYFRFMDRWIKRSNGNGKGTS